MYGGGQLHGYMDTYFSWVMRETADPHRNMTKQSSPGGELKISIDIKDSSV